MTHFEIYFAFSSLKSLRESPSKNDETKMKWIDSHEYYVLFLKENNHAFK